MNERQRDETGFSDLAPQVSALPAIPNRDDCNRLRCVHRCQQLDPTNDRRSEDLLPCAAKVQVHDILQSQALAASTTTRA